jgi:hypothetical protein
MADAAVNRARAIEFLLGQQAEDGGIRSTTYGPLKAGAATTALVLYAASHLPDGEWQPHLEQLQHACRFLQPGIAKQGAVAAPDGTLDYPAYGAAMLLVAARRIRLLLPALAPDRLGQHLLHGQLGDQHRIAADSIHYGGWDLDAGRGATGDQLRGSNISLAAFALEAISDFHKDLEITEAAIRRARAWVLRCQNADGGFVFHALRSHPGNKAKWRDDAHQRAISYATPTCDGLRCLKYCGLSNDEQPVRRAVHWLETHPDVVRVPGFEAQAKEEGWDEGLRYYYFFTQAKALAQLPQAEARRRAEAIQKALAGQQRPDGSFKNDQPRMFEDDPLLATSLAIIAAAEAERALMAATPG